MTEHMATYSMFYEYQVIVNESINKHTYMIFLIAFKLLNSLNVSIPFLFPFPLLYTSCGGFFMFAP